MDTIQFPPVPLQKFLKSTTLSGQVQPLLVPCAVCGPSTWAGSPAWLLDTSPLSSSHPWVGGAGCLCGSHMMQMPGALYPPTPRILWSGIPSCLWCPRHLPAVTRPPFSWQAHMEAVHADWKEYLNLLICEESHLKYMEDYHQVPAGPGAPLVGALRAHLAYFWPQCRSLQEPCRVVFPGLPLPTLKDMGVPRACLALVGLPGGPGLESVSSPGQCEAQK